MTDSEASRQDIMRHLRLPAGRVFVSYLGVDACPDVADQAAREVEVRARYVLPSGAFLLYLGGSDPRKNLSRTIEGYGRMVERSRIDGIQPPALVIAGKPSRSGGLLAEDPHPVIERLGLRDHVRFIGWVDEKDKFVLYRLATGVLFLSEYEGFGLPVLEAMACEAGYPG